ncbi:phosphopantothenoylcysteine decarboxylase/phosphopantothenate--cysteine ligase [Thermovibrio guaymasensis]|uniref:Coenzyme A biosynthesis bifunctional protein CoaBC n=1 Tax=Thermovibrio guaymasensis TaxID=240167 RepID=A0A420W9P2_9BACT|nr:bifunctional phosphopantothenoylcysteine decarboxylase/phosphopantothenate--cysteine ligase CoaBC [Thermovibrio guaymasensis]RKQ63978.1 phosphopantothenoylcysteine decarboxylase/phosphopantothenate--cysteine ligase [Thermovibrio guaymasensis]
MKVKGKKIVLGITGSIAAYKGIEVVRELQKRGATVKAAITEAGKSFIGKLTLEALTGYPVYDKVIPKSGTEIRHTSLAQWGELLVIAPATANTLAKIAYGIADTSVTELALCFGRGIVAPAMNVRMYENPVTQENMKKLRDLGWEIVEPKSGYLACGETGRGRLAEVREIVEAVEYWFYPKILSGKKVVVTAGPTREYIDPVRFISNPSSGKMGYAIAKVAAAMGAEVTLISGKTCLDVPYRVKRITVETVEQMKEAALKEFEKADVYISAAAVGDYTPVKRSNEKIKKGEGELVLRLKRTTDILKLIGQRKREDQVVVGFAAETGNLVKNAKEKLRKKNLDLIVANDVRKGVFGSSETEVFVLNSKGNFTEIRGSKEGVAEGILKLVAEIMKRRG